MSVVSASASVAVKALPMLVLGCRVLCYRACRGAGCETRCFVDVRYIDSDIDGVCEFGIRDGNRHSVNFLGFIIQRCTCLELSVGAIDTKRRCIGATEGIGERIIIRICCGDGTADVDTGACIFCHRTRRAGAFCEDRGAVFVYIRDIDSDINAGCELLSETVILTE